MKTKVYNGIVVKVAAKQITILCEDGSFKNVPRPKNEVPQIGESYAHVGKKMSTSLGTKYASLVSALFVAVFVFYMSTLIGEAESYLFAVDINPSIEVYTDEDLNATKIEYLNDEGKLIVDSLANKSKKIDIILEEIITVATEQKYITKGNEMVSITVVPLTKTDKVNEQKLQTTINQSLSLHLVSADVFIKKGNKALIAESQKVDLSLNKYQIYEEVKKDNLNISIDQVREKSISAIKQEMNQLKDEAETDLPKDKGADRKADEAEDSEQKNNRHKNEKERNHSEIANPNNNSQSSNRKTNNSQSEQRADDNNKGNRSNDANHNSQKNKKNNQQNEGLSKNENKGSGSENSANKNKPNNNGKNPKVKNKENETNNHEKETEKAANENKRDKGK